VVWFPDGTRALSLLRKEQISSGNRPSFHSLGLGDCFVRVTWPGLEVDCSPNSTDIMNEHNYSSALSCALDVGKRTNL
jgi:hypothetical protein